MSLIISKATWEEFKSTISSKKLLIHFDENDSFYFLFAADGPIIYSVNLTKDNPPSADQVDFETFFKNSANEPERLPIVAYDMEYPTETATTANTVSNVRPVQGNFNVSRFRTKHLYIENVGTNEAIVQVQGQFLSSSRVDLVSGLRLNSGEILVITEESPFQSIAVLAYSAISEAHTQISTNGYALGN